MEIDVDDLEANTKYAVGSRAAEIGMDLSGNATNESSSVAFDETHPTIKHFWIVIRMFDKAEKEKRWVNQLSNG